MRADRLVSILLTLQVHGTLTTTELANRLEVTPRTIHRDMDVLSGIGVPVVASRGRNGGWSLPAEYRGSARWLSSDEVSALAIRNPEQMLSALGVGAAADAAWLKLVASLPPVHREDAIRIAGRIHLDVEPWKPLKEDLPYLPLLKQAVFGDHKLTMTYRDASGSTVSREIAPLGLVARGTTWYVVAEIDEHIRTYRVSRILSAAVLPETFVRPEGFDLAAWWAASKQEIAKGLPKYPVRVRVRADAVDGLRQELRWGKIEEIAPSPIAGFQDISVLFELQRYAIATVLSLGERVVVIEPEELRDSIRDSLKATIALYIDP